MGYENSVGHMARNRFLTFVRNDRSEAAKRYGAPDLSIDRILSFRPKGEILCDTGRTFTVQVKALRRKNYFPIMQNRIEPKHIYVFVTLNKADA